MGNRNDDEPQPLTADELRQLRADPNRPETEEDGILAEKWRRYRVRRSSKEAALMKTLLESQNDAPKPTASPSTAKSGS